MICLHKTIHKYFDMGCACTLIVVALVFIIIWVYTKIKFFFEVPCVPKLQQIWWGPGDPKTEVGRIEPFEISISDAVR